jgi:hypothetical protein
MHRRVYSLGLVERKAGKPMRIVAANEGRQADGIDLRMEGADLARYLSNPIIGYGHDYWGRDALPIGKAVSTVVEGPQLFIEPEFDQDDEFAVTIERKMRGGYLNAVSIGFDTYDINEFGVPARWELVETSVVPLGMDPAALVASRGAVHPCPRCAVETVTAPPGAAPPAVEQTTTTHSNGATRRREQLIRMRARIRSTPGGE